MNNNAKEDTTYHIEVSSDGGNTWTKWDGVHTYNPQIARDICAWFNGESNGGKGKDPEGKIFRFVEK